MSDDVAMEVPRLPAVLPVFPLPGALLLPGAHLPLHVFEPRYRNLVTDVLAEDRIFGVIQPVDGDDDPPRLYPVGCAGRIQQLSKIQDGRFLILIAGLQRFRVEYEHELRRGYRCVVAAYDQFAPDLLEKTLEVDPLPLRLALQRFAAANDVELDEDRLGQLGGRTLLNSVAMALPFSPAEKQALLEADDLDHRHRILLSLLEMQRPGATSIAGSELAN